LIDKKDFIIVILVGFMLAVTFYPRITASQSSVASPSEYDPWIDYNDDGKIDHKDLLQFASVYATSGDRTKDVFVTNWPGMESGLDQSLGSATIPPKSGWYSSSALLDGYKQYYIYVKFSGPSGQIYYLYYQFKAGGIWVNKTWETLPVPFSGMRGPFDVVGPELRLYLYNSLTSSISVQFAIYAPPYS
jgi:hypothetical protein